MTKCNKMDARFGRRSGGIGGDRKWVKDCVSLNHNKDVLILRESFGRRFLLYDTYKPRSFKK